MSDARFVAFLILLPGLLFARIIEVPGDQGTIQQAIHTAESGDTVLVHPGVYVENIDFEGKSIVVGSLFVTTGDPHWVDSTVIDGDRTGESVVVIRDVGGEDAFLIGMTVRNGMAQFGGGIECNGSVATIERCAVRGNTAIQYGGGIACIESAVFINHCTVRDNETDNGGGGGVYCDGSTLAILYSDISYNSTDIIDGGGIYSRDSNPYITNCTIAMNSVDAHGGGIFCREASDVIVTNTILWGNLPQQVWIWEDNRVTVGYSDVEGGEGEVVTDNPEAYLRWQEGNIDLPPRFADAEGGDLHLTWANFPVDDRTKSPCIDSGDPDSFGDPDLTRADMGGFYFPQRPAISVQPEALEFTGGRVGQMDWLEVNIVNAGGEALRIASQTIIPEESPFVVGHGGGEVDIRPDELHQTWVRFFPPNADLYRAVLRIESNDIDRPVVEVDISCLLYTSPSPRDLSTSRMPSSA